MDAAQEQVIAGVARQVVAEVAPQELALFRPVSQAYFRDPKKTLKGEGGANRMLGFGGATAATLVTPLVLQSAQTALDSLASRFLGYLNSEAQRIDSWLADLKAHPTVAPAASISTTADDLEPPPEVYDQVREIVAQQLLQLNCPRDQADQLAAKVCSALAQGKLAHEALAQQYQLASQVHELRIEIDEIRKSRDVEQVVGSDSFAQIRQRALELRRQTSQR